MGKFAISAIGALALFILAGCDDPAMMAAGPAAQVAPAHYDAVPDSGMTVPAVPVAEMPADMLQQQVTYASDQPVGTIIIDPSTKHLYLITARNRALRYGIAVGRTGFGWSGEADIVGRTTWPRWIPPYEMIARRPELEKFRDVGQPGGLTNPLGARALYLRTNGVDYGYRIHGTPEWDSIGHNASSGCIRMINQDVMDLYNRVPDGTYVIVLTEDGQFPDRLSVPKPGPKARKPKAEPTPVTAPVEPAIAASGRV